MCPNATVRGTVVLLAFAGTLAMAQSHPEWPHIGNGAIELALPAVATGPVDRVWYSSDGETLYARTHPGRTFSTSDFETWKPVQDASAVPPPDADPPAPNSPEPGARAKTRAGKMYGFARNAFRSDDNGSSWINLTAYKGTSILGSPLSDLAVSPLN